MITTPKTRSLRFDAVESTLVLTTPHGVETYAVHYLPAPVGVRVVRLGKWDLSAKYTVTLPRTGVAHCDCPAGKYRKACKHADAITLLSDRGSLPIGPQVFTTPTPEVF